MINLDGLSNRERNETASALDHIAHHGEGDPDAHETTAEILQAFRSMASYARHANVAAEYRKAGEIVWATHHEKRCEEIYSQLPDWARW